MISVREYIEQLKSDGYSIRFDTRIKGASGRLHRVNGLAMHQEHGKKSVFWLEKRKDAVAEMIETFAIAYDTGAMPCFAIDGEPSEDERKLVELYKLRLLSKVDS